MLNMSDLVAVPKDLVALHDAAALKQFRRGGRKHSNAVPDGLLPSEIWCQIFRAGIDYTAPNNVNKFRETARYLSRITSICQYLRGIAIDYAPLWTRIAAECHYRPPVNFLPLQRLYLLRSKGAEIDLDFYLPSANPTIYNDVIQTISPHLFRCWRIKITFLDFATANHILPLTGPLPSLRHFELGLVDPAFNDGLTAYNLID